MIQLLLPLLMGILLGHQIEEEWPMWLSMIALLLCLLLICFRKPGFSGMMLQLFLLLYGMSGGARIGRIPDQHFSKGDYQHLICRVNEVTNYTWGCRGTVDVIKVVDTLGRIREKRGQIVFRSFLDPNQLSIGSVWLLNRSDIRETDTAVLGAGYAAYLKRQGVFHSATINSIENQVGKSSLNFAERARRIIRSATSNLGLSTSNTAIIYALLTGDKAGIDKSIRRDFARSGVVHVLAVSGMHVGMLFLVLNFLFKYAVRSKKIRAVLILICLWSYCAVAGFSPSISRACTMFTFIIVADSLGRRTSIYNSIAASAFLLLIINPANLLEIGFQLSYSAVIGIVWMHPKLNSMLSIGIPVVKPVWSLCCVSIAAQLGTLPLVLYYFGQFPTYFLISNLITIPMITYVFCTSLAAVVLSVCGYSFPQLHAILDYPLWCLRGFLRSISTADYAVVNWNVNDLLHTSLMVAVIIFLFQLCFQGRIRKVPLVLATLLTLLVLHNS